MRCSKIPCGYSSFYCDNIRAKLQPGQLLSAWIEVPNFILHTAEEKLNLVLRYVRGGIGQSLTLEVDSVDLQIINADLGFET